MNLHPRISSISWLAWLTIVALSGCRGYGQDFLLETVYSRPNGDFHGVTIGDKGALYSVFNPQMVPPGCAYGSEIFKILSGVGTAVVGSEQVEFPSRCFSLIYSPFDVAVNPITGQVYWSDNGLYNPGISSTQVFTLYRLNSTGLARSGSCLVRGTPV